MSRNVRLPKTRSANTNMNALEENWVRVWVCVRVYVYVGGGGWGVGGRGFRERGKDAPNCSKNMYSLPNQSWTEAKFIV